ncbi:GAF domain-containing protein [Rhizobium sp. 768_B6_N1_8]|uniref:GAF domain-containing protein n=1 Tax=unclassified Rhizobium TaxID=2613769 RepID=UPI003F274316
MTITLSDIASCFEGIYPSIIATRSADGMPNISYLSHILPVDLERIAISNQFFAKTAANIRSDPHVTFLVVDPQSGQQYQLLATWESSADHGPVFDTIAMQLKVSSAQAGLSDVMRLRTIELFNVNEIVTVGNPHLPRTQAKIKPDISMVAAVTHQLADLSDPGEIVAKLLDAVLSVFEFQHAMILLSDAARGVLAAADAIGYNQNLVGAEVPLSVGLIGQAAASGSTLRINDLSRMRRMGEAITETSPEDPFTREVPLPGLADAMSQIAIPLIVSSAIQGVLFVESKKRFAFDNAVTSGLEILARHAALLLALNELLADEAVALPSRRAPATTDTSDLSIDAVYHSFDHSIFIARRYVIKGVAARILLHMLQRGLASTDFEFTNRELRASLSNVLPEFKDNLETRLLLLRRRLDELELPLRLLRTGRGKLLLEIRGRLNLVVEN